MCGRVSVVRRIEEERERLTARRERRVRALLDIFVDEGLARDELRGIDVLLADLTPPDEDIVGYGRQLLTIPELSTRITALERRDVVGATLEAVSVDLREKRVDGFRPRRQMEPLFRAMEIAGINERGVCVWRPRAGSNRRSRGDK